MKLYKPGFKKDGRKYFLTQRVIEGWNLLDKQVVEVEKTSGFKKKYDKWVADKRGVSEASPYIYITSDHSGHEGFFFHFPINGQAWGWVSTDLCANRVSLSV